MTEKTGYFQSRLQLGGSFIIYCKVLTANRLLFPPIDGMMAI
jgi:hypothetical protein